VGNDRKDGHHEDQFPTERAGSVPPTPAVAVIRMTASRSIHVGIDSTWRGAGAVEWAQREAALRHERLRAVHVIDDRLRRSPYWEPVVVDDAATRLMNDVQEHLDGSGSPLDHDLELLVGTPGRLLADNASDSTMLVVGRRGIGAFKRLLIGSTSEDAVAEARVPVVVVPDGWKPSDHTGPVVIAVNESEGQQDAIDFAVTAAAERHVPLRLVHVWDMPKLYGLDDSVVDELEREWARNALRQWEAVAKEWRSRYPGTCIEVDVRRGHPVEGVVTAVQRCDAQLLVIRGHRHHRTTSVLLGAVTRGVLQHAACPVGVVHAS
jgi:nucleotide-binding universal stress UspA family protein